MRRRKFQAVASGRPAPLVYVGLGLVLAAAAFPFYWTILIGSGDQSTVYDPNLSPIPGGNLFSNMKEVIDNPTVNFWRALWNSVVVSTTIAASTVLLSTLAGFAFAKLRFKGSRGLLVAVIATMAVPVQLGVVPLYILMYKFGWTGNIGAVIIPSLVSAFGVFWMTQYLQQSLPTEIIESARVDGCNMIRTFWHMALPAARPAAAMLALFTFTSTWNNFFWPYIVLPYDNPTLPVALATLQSEKFKDYSSILAGTLLATIPLLALFVVAGKQLVSGIMQGAVKG